MKLALALLFLSWSVGAAPVFLAPTNPPAQVQLAWDASADPSVTGYNLYYGVASRSYTNSTPIMGATNANSQAITIVRGVTYFFAVTASNSVVGLESDFSTEVSYTAPAPPTAPNLHTPVILHVQSAPTPSGQWSDAGINWSLSPDQASQYFRLQLATSASPQVMPRALSVQQRAINAMRAIIERPSAP